MFIFFICQNVKDFRKWMTLLPEVLKNFNTNQEVYGDINQIGFNFEEVPKNLPIRISELENLKYNAEFVISDSEDGKIELYRRINEKFKRLYDNFDNKGK